jgi:SAM-dependent methyltransferase
VTRSLPPDKWRRIQAYQAAEIARLASDSRFAREISLQDNAMRIGEWLPPGGKGSVLELGCGPGRFVAILASLGYDVVGVDPHEYPDWEVIKRHRAVDFRSGIKAEHLPFPDRSFDFVACLGALLYFEDADLALQEIHRVLKPGGRLVVRNVNRLNLVRVVTGSHLDPAARNYYTEQELADTLRAHGFSILHTATYGFYSPIFPMAWWYLINGTLSLSIQEALSRLVPRGLRMSVTACAERT